MFTGILIALACVFCYLAGWTKAHRTIANECKRLGKFYVGNETFTCTKIEEGVKKPDVSDKESMPPA